MWVLYKIWDLFSLVKDGGLPPQNAFLAKQLREVWTSSAVINITDSKKEKPPTCPLTISLLDGKHSPVYGLCSSSNIHLLTIMHCIVFSRTNQWHLKLWCEIDPMGIVFFRNEDSSELNIMYLLITLCMYSTIVRLMLAQDLS